MSGPTSPPTSTGWARIAAVVGALSALLIVLLSAFALPPLHSGPHKVPLAVAGEPAGGRELASRTGAYELTTVGSAEQARQRILDREAYGALVGSGPRTRLLVAGAASPAVAAELRSLAAELRLPGGGAIPVRDVRPLPDADPDGSGLVAGALPLALGGWIGGVALLAAVRGARRQAAGAVGFACLGGLTLTALLQYAFGTLDGDYWATAAAATLGLSATAWTILGLRTALGNAGLGLGAVILIVVGNPLSGLSTAPELLPSGWGTLGQLLPPGATGSLLRSVAYFDGAGGLRSGLVLCCWLAAGAALFAIGARRAARPVPAASATASASAPALTGDSR